MRWRRYNRIILENEVKNQSDFRTIMKKLNITERTLLRELDFGRTETGLYSAAVAEQRDFGPDRNVLTWEQRLQIEEMINVEHKSIRDIADELGVNRQYMLGEVSAGRINGPKTYSAIKAQQAFEDYQNGITDIHYLNQKSLKKDPSASNRKRRK